MPELERIPPEEAAQIDNIVRLTIGQLKQRYTEQSLPVRRGVHPKDHGCVTATFQVLGSLPEHLRVGVFAEPGRAYDAWVRFSNAAVDPLQPDSAEKAGAIAHGSRGMAVKLLGVKGTPLFSYPDELTQDFLMINQPVFSFSNVEDYEALSKVLLEDRDKLDRFFKERVRIKDGKPDVTDAVTRRTLGTVGIVRRIQSASLTGTPPAYQAPPLSPVDNRYFSAAPFLLGDGQAMKFSARPVAPRPGDVTDVSDGSYLRAALRSRLTEEGAKDVLFVFEVQVRRAEELDGKVEAEIEDACFEWDERKYPFTAVALIRIAPQDIEAEGRPEVCESLVFSPWHGVAEHRPLGGINRLRQAVYAASAGFRLRGELPAMEPTASAV